MAIEPTIHSMLPEFTSFLHSLAESSASITLPLFENPSVSVDLKSDKTYVTKADRDCETFLREKIRAKFPSHGVIGEEFGEDNPSAEWVWVVDPIDGTASYVHQIPLFTTLIGLMHHGKPVLGAIYQPVLKKLCIGSAEGTKLNGKSVRVRDTKKLSDATLVTSGFSGLHGSLPPSAAENLVKAVHLFRTWGDGWGYLMLASGNADIMIDGTLKLWDLVAVLPVIEGAGGAAISTKNGDPMKDLSLVATNHHLLPEVMKVVHPYAVG